MSEWGYFVLLIFIDVFNLNGIVKFLFEYEAANGEKARKILSSAILIDNPEILNSCLGCIVEYMETNIVSPRNGSSEA